MFYPKKICKATLKFKQNIYNYQTFNVYKRHLQKDAKSVPFFNLISNHFVIFQVYSHFESFEIFKS